MSHPLDGCRIKIERAHDARQALNQDVLRFRGRQPHKVIATKDTGTGRGVLRLQVVEEPPRPWSAVIGEIIHDIRSALDHLTWALTELEQGPAPNPLPPGSPWRSIQFPIVDSPGQFSDAATRQLWGVLSSDRDDIEGWQPCNRPDVAQLQRLRDLSNIDKHRRLHIVAAMPERREEYIPSIRAEACEVSSPEITAHGPLEDGAELARFIVRATGPNPRVFVEHAFTFDLTFAEGGPTSGWELDFISILQALAFGAHLVVESFAHRFD